ncbi:hypothetical protein SELMODRAFT_405740 [Selaginella moellendorffii]|uniref:Calcineurin-like phosphoesterase domain-containing protein n=1 Tax=Selaginella moellendorffii TaxID=88036 RepID=D8QZK1_SELML|nr:hypothetical protein SELMODRAFT_405740 [Selaginella moellendorffii]
MGKSRIAIVGDVHGAWDSKLDAQALELLKPDLVLFVGDFGDENVQIVQEISKLGMPKAAILGNHDCCYSAAHKPTPKKCSSAIKRWARVDQMLKALGDDHVGYRRKDYPDLKLSVIGVRPFATGGDRFYNSEFLSSTYGVDNMEQSATRIAQLALSAPKGHSLVFLGHNGPAGLGSQPGDICGKDFDKGGGGDHGDPDFARALDMVREQDASRVALVVFGHMHRQLLGYNRGKQRKMCLCDAKSAAKTGTVYVNGAVVPRCEDERRHFTVVDMAAGRVESVRETWVAVPKDGPAHLACEEVLFAHRPVLAVKNRAQGKTKS